MSIPGSASPLFFQTAAADAAAGPIKSVRFSSGDSAYLNRTPSSAGNRKKWTWAGWVKRSGSGANKALFGTDVSNNTVQLVYNSSDNLRFQVVVSGTSTFIDTDAVFRDFSGWYHVTLVFDSAQATAANRTKIYVNGTEQSVTGSFCAQNTDGIWNSANAMNIGQTGEGSYEYYFDGYLADVYFIDGQALDPTSFGAFDDSGVWQSAVYSGTFGTNGFHLFDFANESGIGNDSSGNDNDFTVNNLTASTLDYSTSGGTVTNAGNALDGNDNTYSQTSTGANSTYTFSPAISVSSGRIDLRARNHSSLTYKAVTNAGTITFTLQGTWPGSGHVDYPGWYYISNASVTSISQIILETSDSSVNWTFTGFQVAGSPSSVGDQFVTAVASSNLDILFDVPTNGDSSDDTGAGGEVSGNYCTGNPLHPNMSASVVTLSEGNLKGEISSGSSWHTAPCTIGVSSGKWYFEQTIHNSYAMVGIAAVDAVFAINGHHTGTHATGVGYFNANGDRYTNNTATSYGASYGDGDVIGCAFDMDARSVTFYKNGVSQGEITSIITANKTYAPVFSLNGQDGAGSYSWNFGQRAFAYSAPSGYKALCTANLPDPTIADGSDYFDAKIWTGDGTNNRKISTPFSPDWVWVKDRGNAYSHRLFDTVRGDDKGLVSNSDAAEGTVSLGMESDGFVVEGSSSYNDNTDSYVAWTWDAGSSTASNTDGSITTSVRANQTAGFSIVSYTGTGANATIGHGLNAAPEFAIFKARNGTNHWLVYHKSLGNGKKVNLNLTDAASSSSTFFQNTDPTSSVMYLGTESSGNWSGYNMIGYLFSGVAGYSAFGTYTGNGSSNGPFVYTGFKPAWVLYKKTNSTSDWYLDDYKREGYNSSNNNLYPNDPGVESTGVFTDFFSNGFQLVTASSVRNGSGDTFIYAAFAENPFQANGGLAR